MQVYLVGGAVRDELLGYPTNEFDYVVVGATPEEMKAKGFTPVGKDFPVFLHPKTKDEYALARTERKSGHGYLGFTFNAAPDITLEQDLIRRDLTINAIAKSESGEFTDPYNGQSDIANKTLRHVSDAFREDPVRILRTARFAARYHHLGFSIAEETLALMKTMVDNGEANHLVSERVWKEFSRAFGERHPEVFLQVLFECGALEVIAPELVVPSQNAATIAALQASCARSKNINIRIAALFHELASTSNQDREQLVTAFFDRISAPKETRELAALVVRHSQAFSSAFELSAEQLLTLFSSCDAIRRRERFENFLFSCTAVQISLEDKAYPQMDYLLSGLSAVKNMDIQHLLSQGLKGKELGDAIAAQRIETLETHRKNWK
ncbi:MAG: multifunctional CCA addition/repair protein [Agarilytica sp.]